MTFICPVCLYHHAHAQTGSEADRIEVRCKRCGLFEIDLPARVAVERLTENGANRYLLSGIVRENSERGHRLVVTEASIGELIASARVPRTPLEAIDRLLLHVLDSAESPSAYVRIRPESDYPLVYAHNGHALAFYLSKAHDLGYLERGNGGDVRLDMRGWSRVAELRRTRVVSDQAFVAMWFSGEMRDAWTGGFEPALRATGYHPLRLDLEEHNDKIDDRIIAEIRRSGLVVADFTGHRGGVYFEAGFALGLGIPVVWTCRESDVHDLHFDTRQYNYIAWNDPEDLRARLQLRIEATIPNFPAARKHV